MPEVQKVYTPKYLKDLISLPTINDSTVVLASNNVQTGKVTLLGLRQYLNIDAIDTDFSSVLTSINTLNLNVAQNTSDIETLSSSVSTKLSYTTQSGNTFIASPIGNVSFTLAGDAAVKITGSGLEFGASGPKDFWGSGTPEGVITAVIGSTFRRTDGGASTSFYVKESGTGNTGWVAK